MNEGSVRSGLAEAPSPACKPTSCLDPRMCGVGGTTSELWLPHCGATGPVAHSFATGSSGTSRLGLDAFERISLDTALFRDPGSPVHR